MVREAHFARPRRCRRRRPVRPTRSSGAARETAAPTTHAPESASRPATEWIAVTSSASSSVSAGRIDGSRRASIVLPAPGGPTSRHAWPPAAAISSARLAVSCPTTSAKSAVVGRRGARAGLGASQRAAAKHVDQLDRASAARRAGATGRATPRSTFAGGSTSARVQRRCREVPRDGQHAAHAAHAAVEPELAEHGEPVDGLRRRGPRWRREVRSRSADRIRFPPFGYRRARAIR